MGSDGDDSVCADLCHSTSRLSAAPTYLQGEWYALSHYVDPEQALTAEKSVSARLYEAELMKVRRYIALVPAIPGLFIRGLYQHFEVSDQVKDSKPDPHVYIIMNRSRQATTPSPFLSRWFAAFLIVSLFPSSSIQVVATDLPTIALIPDAWHSPIHYVELIRYLSEAGHSIVAQRLPGCNSELPMVQSSAADAAYIRENILLPEIGQGKEVVLVAHSYGSCPGAVAAKGLSITERREANLKGGVIGLIFICGFITRSGHTLSSMLPGGRLEPWVVDYVRLIPRTLLLSIRSFPAVD